MTGTQNDTLLPSAARLRRAAWLVALAWTLFLALALALRARDVRRETHKAALEIARAHFAQDQVLRLWTAARGGIYVPVDEHTQPSPWLEHLPERDVAAPDGRRLTLMDPASLVQQMAAESPELYGITGRVTSLEPLRAENAPDAWERAALKMLADGRGEVAEFVGDGNEARLRLMRPMVTRDACVKCHVAQAGAVGRVHGGASVTVPMEPLYTAEHRGHRRALWMVGPLWLLGLGGTWMSRRIIGQQVERRRQAVVALQAAHDQLLVDQEIYRAGPVVVFRCLDTAGWPVVQISANVKQVLGHDAADFLSGAVTMAQVLHPGELARVQRAAGELGVGAIERPLGDPLRLLHRDGSTVWVLANPVTRERRPDGVMVLQGYLIDVTRWREAETALRESEERLDMALRGAELGVWDWDLTNDHVVFDERWAQMLGHRLDEIPPNLEAWSTRVHPDDMPRVTATLQAHLDGRTPIYREQFRMRRSDGQWCWILDTGKVLARDDTGRPLRAAGVHQDITAQKHAEAAREEALERFRALVENLQSGMLVETVERRVVQANRAFCGMFGIADPTRLPGADCAQTAAGAAALFADPAGFLDRVRDILAGGEVVANEELALRDGRTFERDYVPIVLGGRHGGNMWIYRDVTRRKRLEKEAVQQERLAAVGQLSAGIAHDFNNILCSIMGFTELLQSSPDMPASAQGNLRRIGDSSRRAAHLVRQILDFSQKTRRKVQLVDLEACLREAEAFLAASLPENVRIELRVAPGPYSLQAEPAQLQQMITNLAINARDAMPGGGELRLALSRGEADDPQGRCNLCGQAMAGEWLRLEVGDNGTGIAENVLPLIFEPFFTTKNPGEGTGLGLPQAVGIVAQHGGHILVRTAIGRGTTFTVLLPPSDAQPVATPPPAPCIARGAGQSILLVEDELSVSEALGAMLRHLGYRVTAAASGHEALDCFAREEGRFDLVLTDVVMPDMDGEALCARLCSLAPGVRIIAMSGYPLGARGAGLLEQGARSWLQKPITFEQLATTVAEALAGGAGPVAGA